MAYGKKHKDHVTTFLKRVKDMTTLVVGQEYHLRKQLSRDGNVIKDEVHDIILKEFKEENLISEDDAKFSSTEYEIFIRKPL
jgi:hypothetical protein